MQTYSPYLVFEVEEMTPDIMNDFHCFNVKMNNNMRGTQSTESTLKVINSSWIRRSAAARSMGSWTIHWEW